MVSTDFPRCSLHAVGWARRVLQKMEVQITHTLSKHNLVATSTIKDGEGVCHLLEATLPPFAPPWKLQAGSAQGQNVTRCNSRSSQSAHSKGAQYKYNTLENLVQNTDTNTNTYRGKIIVGAVVAPSWLW